jgi:hypothetical protein
MTSLLVIQLRIVKSWSSGVILGSAAFRASGRLVANGPVMVLLWPGHATLAGLLG